MAVVNLDEVAWLDDTDQSLRLDQIAKSRGVEAEAWDITGLRPNRHHRDELLVINRDDLPRFLGEWAHFGIDLLDLGFRPSEEDAQTLAFDINAATPGGVLDHCPSSMTYFSSHDDLYFHGEVRMPGLPPALLRRSLALHLAAGAAARGQFGHTISLPDSEFVEQLLERSSVWAGVLRENPNPDEISTGLVPQKWRIGERVADNFLAILTYSLHRRQWTVTFVLRKRSKFPH